MDKFETNKNGTDETEINVEQIMEKIRENIRNKKEPIVFSEGDVGDPQTNLSMLQIDDSNIQRSFEYINSNWDPRNNSYFISSHRPVVGKFLIRGRELVNGEIKRYVDPIFWKQTKFNRNTVRFINYTTGKFNHYNNEMEQLRSEIDSILCKLRPELEDKIEQLRPELEDKIEQLRPELEDKIEQLRPELEDKIEQLRPELEDKIEQLRPELEDKIEQLRPELEDKIEQLRPELEDKIKQLRPEFEDRIEYLRSEFENKIRGLRSEINNITGSDANSVVNLMKLYIENRAWLASIIENKANKEEGKQKIENFDTENLDINYFKFEEQFRGSRESIRQRQSNFLNYFTGCSNVLDIGCGRGEFLELLKELGICGKGIDIDDTMVHYCLSKGLNVKQEEAISYLENLEDKSLDGIFIDQVVEHLEPSYLINLLLLCFQKLKYGYYIFVETVNPLSFVSLVNFYIDMTHKKPIHPETLKYLLTSVGFRDLEVNFSSPLPEEVRLQKVPINSGLEDWAKNYLDTYNCNIEKLNNILYAAQDYAVIGKKRL
jgi:2-polyprenyl-3-methyl-5-hydroxy-6-metoxy-1,4-benzoquinol methylase/gas vesicle protein